ncbi:MAG: hypothetical protein V4489_06900 [Chlamydiota bacterium]
MSQSFTAHQETLLLELDLLQPLVEELKQACRIEERISILDKERRVWEFCAKTFLPDLSLDQELVIKSVVAIGQDHSFFSKMGFPLEGPWMENLLSLENFYREIGGIVGYHFTLVQFLCRPKKRFSLEKAQYHAPLGYDLSTLNAEVKTAIYHAIEKMGEISEMYPVGGAADRLRLQDPETKEPLPAALLLFNGKAMLGHLVEDVQAREYLYYKVKGKQICIPIAMMTSQEKDNHQKILRLCEDSRWFLRPKNSFAFFCQPLVPAVDRAGNWICTGPMQLLLKPGGHGVIWKLARDSGTMAWLQEKGAKKAIIRQINNPISSEDYGLLAFSGHGLKEDRRFGFASCERQVRASEGINVIVEEEVEGGFSYTLTNIEYCDFGTYGIEDAPVSEVSQYSKFPSNTNLLFVDLGSILEALKKCPIPGMLANFKKVSFRTTFNESREEEIGRLESTMQNIADCFPRHSQVRLGKEELLKLDSYITFNKRSKTISATKKECTLGSSLLETPKGCFLDVLKNRQELLQKYCAFSIFELEEDYLSPPFLFNYHQALGPLYSVIGQKIRGGRLSYGSELQLQIAECDIANLVIEGSLRITAERIMGEVDESGVLRYSEKVGRCTLKNVRICNQGIDLSLPNVFWKGEIYRKESCFIYLEGESELYAEDVTLTGDKQIIVEDGWRLTIKQVNGEVTYRKEKLLQTPWCFTYAFTPDYTLQIQRPRN